MLSRRFLLATLFMGLVAAGCGSSHNAKTSSTTTSSQVTTTTTSTTTTTTTAPPGVVPAVGLKSYVTSVPSPNLVANISYPILGGMASNQIESNINATIYKAVTGYVASFEKQLQNVSPTTTGAGGPAGNGAEQSQISGSFTKELVDSRYVSFKFLISTYAVAAASPTTESESLTFDLGSGDLLSLSSLFSTTNYLQTISTLSRTAINAKLGQSANQAFVNLGTQPNATNFASWNLTNTGFELTFSQGQVAPMASGVVTIEIPYSQLSAVAKSPGPLTKP